MLRNRNSLTSRTQSPVQDQLIQITAPSPIRSPLFKSVEEKVSECLYGSEVIDLEKLKKLSWNGIPEQYRSLCWKVLMVKEEGGSSVIQKLLITNFRDTFLLTWIDMNQF
jgi:hypothetical protein